MRMVVLVPEKPLEFSRYSTLVPLLSMAFLNFPMDSTSYRDLLVDGA